MEATKSHDEEIKDQENETKEDTKEEVEESESEDEEEIPRQGRSFLRSLLFETILGKIKLNYLNLFKKKIISSFIH